MKNIKGKTISIVLCLALVFGSTLNVFASSNPAQGIHFYDTFNSWSTQVTGQSVTVSGKKILGDILVYLDQHTNQNLSAIWGQLHNSLDFNVWHTDSEIAQPQLLGTNISTANLIGYAISILSRNTYDIWIELDDINNTLTDLTIPNYTSILNAIASSISNIGVDTNNIVSLLSNNISPNYKVISFGSTQFTPDNGNRNFLVNTYSNNSVPYVGYRSTSTGGYSFYHISPSSTSDWLNILNNNIVQLFTSVVSANTYYRLVVPDFSNGTVSNLRSYSVMDSLSELQRDVGILLNRISYVIADSDTISRKRDNASKNNSVLDNFVSSNGGASASVSDFTGAKDSVNSVKNGLATGTNISNILNIYNSDDGYSFFSQTVANDINGVSSLSNSTRYKSNSVDSYYTPLLDEKMNALYSVMGVINGK